MEKLYKNLETQENESKDDKKDDKKSKGSKDKKSKESREKRYAFRVKKYEKQIEQEKARLVNGLIKDLKIWLGNAEKFSNDIMCVCYT